MDTTNTVPNEETQLDHTGRMARLRTLRDELALKIHLAGADAKQLWETAETKFHRLEGELKRLGQELKEPTKDVKGALDTMFHEVTDAYDRMKTSLARPS